MSPAARNSVMASANYIDPHAPELPGVPAAPLKPTLASFNQNVK
jgi:hypothetical protein